MNNVQQYSLKDVREFNFEMREICILKLCSSM